MGETTQDHEVIYLLPECVSPAGEGRCWSEDPIDCEIPGCEAYATKYVRADRLAAIEARVRELADSIGDSIVMDGDPIEARANDVRAEIEERLLEILGDDTCDTTT